MLTGKWALVTGSNRGIGRTIIETFAANGAHILANARTEGSLDSICRDLTGRHSVHAHPVYFDVSDPAQVKAGFQHIFKITKQLDITVNNAGVLDNSLLGMLSAQTAQQMFATNALGTIYVMQYAARMMMKQKQGSIINLSSIVGVNGNAGQVAYSGSKAAVVGITRSAAKELAPSNIRVNAIAPGFIDTDMVRSLSQEKFQERMDSIKMNRIGTPQDIADCALFLASDLSRYITGQIIGVDGGMLI
ncbi:MAG: SDR family NAD(P)-dependent oxidoreductase [candidate division Zixibacteria bacterium]|jgi:3-oxoacyl-[acyl-carrier protein] reductase|nr:SDR family NAD(P)-dependent oxidoreductase [candidate division Zixibacteria bacterium]